MKHSENELIGMKLLDLRKMAKVLKVTNIHSFKKAELIQLIINAEAQECMPVIENVVDTIVKSSNKKEYLNNIAKDSLVAFRLGTGKVLSGKVVKLEGENDILLETKNGIKYMVKLNAVLWVKTGARWPKGVYLALKGVSEADEHQRAYTESLRNC